MGKTLKEIALDAVKGNVQFVTQLDKTRRIDICNVCEFKKLRTCTKCGCLIDLKTKIADTSCPLGKW
jgi:hypothetical protein